MHGLLSCRTVIRWMVVVAGLFAFALEGRSLARTPASSLRPPAAQSEFDAAELGEAQIAALADDLAVEVLAVDAHRVVAAVAYVRAALAARLHIRSDAAVP